MDVISSLGLRRLMPAAVLAAAVALLPVAVGYPATGSAKPNDGSAPREWDIAIYDSCLATSGMGMRYCCAQSGGVFVGIDYGKIPPTPAKCVAPSANSASQQPQGPGQAPSAGLVPAEPPPTAILYPEHSTPGAILAPAP